MCCFMMQCKAVVIIGQFTVCAMLQRVKDKATSLVLLLFLYLLSKIVNDGR